MNVVGNMYVGKVDHQAYRWSGFSTGDCDGRAKESLVCKGGILNNTPEYLNCLRRDRRTMLRLMHRPLGFGLLFLAGAGVEH